MAEKKPDPNAEKLIATNPHATSNFTISEVVEAGMVLTGTEVKSMRATSPNIRDAFVETRKRAGTLEAWLINAHIGPYSHGNIWNHEALRARKLLLHRHQIEQIHGAITRDGMTVIAMRMYFRKGRAKVELGVAKGKRKGDKREDLKRKSDRSEIDDVMKKSR